MSEMEKDRLSMPDVSDAQTVSQDLHNKKSSLVINTLGESASLQSGSKVFGMSKPSATSAMTK